MNRSVAVLLAALAIPGLGLAALLTGVVGLPGGQPASPTALPADAPPVTSAAVAMRALPMPDQIARAQTAAFGSAGPATVEAMTYAPGEILWLGDMAVLLSPATNAEDCHACSGGVAVTYLRPERGRFAVAGQWRQAIGGNGFGQPPSEWGVRRDMAAMPVVVAETGFTNQGYSCGIATVTALTAQGPVTSEAIPISFSNAGAVTGAGRRELEGAIVDVRPGEGFVVRGEGVEDRYVMRDGRFVREGGQSPLACE